MNRNTILLLSIATFITIVAWIGFSVYNSFTTSTISETETIEIAPISPDFDQKAVQSILQRKKVDPVFQLSGQQQSSGAAGLKPTPTIQTNPTPATASATPFGTPFKAPAGI